MDSPKIKNVTVVVRPADINDQGFIMASWLNGMRYGNWQFEQIPKEYYFTGYAEHIRKIFEIPGTKIDVAVLSDDPNTIVGYHVYTGKASHWIFVKKDYRGHGIGRLLFNRTHITVATGTTKIGKALIKKIGLKFNPFMEF